MTRPGNQVRKRRHPSKAVDVLLGLGFLAATAGLLVGAVLAYDRAFVPSVDITLRTDTLGSSLQKGSDVKLHGVPVGEVASIRAADRGASLTLALRPETARELPVTTTARLLPKTLFGERYVDLEPTGSGEHLRAGDVIHQDSSQAAAELQQVLDGLLPLLRSIQPEKLQSSLSELATLLRGRGAELGDTLQKWGEYLTKLEPHVPQLADDLEKFASVVDTYADAAPDLLDALSTLTTTSRTLVAERQTLTTVYQRVIAGADTTRGFVADNEQTIDVLSGTGRRALEAAAPYAGEFPCIFRSMRAFIPRMDQVLGKGTKEPGIHVVLNISQGRAAYRPGADAPRFSRNGSPTCPYVPSGVGGTSGRAVPGQPRAIAPQPFAVQGSAVESPGLGQANSRAENQLVAELVAPTQGIRPTDYPRWGSLLLGPVLRGAEVTVR